MHDDILLPDPSHWKDFAPMCGGSRQSPIDLVASAAEYENPGELTWTGHFDNPTVDEFEIMNNHHSGEKFY